MKKLEQVQEIKAEKAIVPPHPEWFRNKNLDFVKMIEVQVIPELFYGMYAE